MTRSRALSSSLRRTLQDVFGQTTLREGQEAVIRRALAGEDTLALMPAEAGEALCHGLPSFPLRGTVLVVSPRVEPLQRLRSGRSEVVCVVPERVGDPQLRASFRRRRVALVVLDAADRVVPPGDVAAPRVRELDETLRSLGRPPLLALSTHAPPGLLDTLRVALDRPLLALIDTGLYRANLHLQVVACGRDDEKLLRTLEALHRSAGPGLVYTATVRACDALHELLRGAGESVTRYHAKLPLAERTHNEATFRAGTARVMIATNAIDAVPTLPALRFVLHWQLPASLGAYFEEAGRAGRDGASADATLLFDRHDKRLQQALLARRHPTADELARVQALLVGAPHALGVAEIAGVLDDLPRAHVTAALEALQAGRVARVDRHHAWSAGSAAADAGGFEAVAAEFAARAEHERTALERVVAYAQTERCRWHVLLEHFGEAVPFTHGRCGHCDNCLRLPLAAATEVVEAP